MLSAAVSAHERRLKNTKLTFNKLKNDSAEGYKYSENKQALFPEKIYPPYWVEVS
jgi:hypothetical protein